MLHLVCTGSLIWTEMVLLGRLLMAMPDDLSLMVRDGWNPRSECHAFECWVDVIMCMVRLQIQPLTPLVDEFAGRLFGELDYIQEGLNAERFQVSALSLWKLLCSQMSGHHCSCQCARRIPPESAKSCHGLKVNGECVGLAREWHMRILCIMCCGRMQLRARSARSGLMLRRRQAMRLYCSTLSRFS